MAALPNICGALCSRPHKVWPPVAGVPCSNAAKTRNPLKFAGVPQTRQQFSAVIGPKFTTLRGQVEEVLLFDKFFCDCRYMPHLRRYGPTNLCDGTNMAIFCILFLASHVQHISDMHSKFGLRPHHVWKYCSRYPIYFALWFLSFFYLFSSPNLSGRRLDVLYFDT